MLKLFKPKKQKARIDDWKLICAGETFVLIGHTPDHPKLGCTSLRTSSLIKIDFNKGTAETRNTIYTLGRECN